LVIYLGNDVLTSLMTQVYGMAAWTNPLHPDAFPGIRKMEAEIVRMCCNLVSMTRYYTYLNLVTSKNYSLVFHCLCSLMEVQIPAELSRLVELNRSFWLAKPTGTMQGTSREFQIPRW